MRLAAFLLIAPALFAVDGTVTNRTTDQPQPGATVTLYKLGGAGPESIESVKSDASGAFKFTQALQGPGMVQAVYEGVVYTHMLPPAMPQNAIKLDVLSVSKQPGDAKLTQHMVLFEPSGENMTVSENFVFENAGKSTYNNPDTGTLRFFVPAEGSRSMQITATAPNSVPVRQAAQKTPERDVYKLDFAIKPGETTIQLGYTVPYKSPATFSSKRFAGTFTSLIAPSGVEVSGDGLESRGREPRTGAQIFQVKAPSYKISIQGEGTLRQQGGAQESESQGPSIEQILPKVYSRLYWILGLGFGILALGFIILLRAQPPAASATSRGKKK